MAFNRKTLARYGKPAAMVLALVLMALREALDDNRVSISETIQMVTTGVTALNVWVVPNIDRFPWVKNATLGIMAGLDFATSAITDNRITPSEGVNLGIVVVATAFALALPAPMHRTVPPPIVPPSPIG